MIGDMGASSNLKRNTRIVGSLVKSISARRSIGEEIAGMEGSEKENKREKGSRTKIDKTSLWIPAACAAGRPHCSKCPARYEIMSVCILRHNDNLSRLRPVEFLLSASLEPFPYLCFRDLTSYFQSAMVATSLSCSFPPSPSILSLSLFFFLFLQFFLFFCIQPYEQCSLASIDIEVPESISWPPSRMETRIWPVVVEIGLVSKFPWEETRILINSFVSESFRIKQGCSFAIVSERIFPFYT